MQPLIVSAAEQEAHANALRILTTSKIEFVVAGAAAVGYYTGLWRNTKDLDLFLTPEDLTPALTALAASGYTVEVPAPHWLAHAYRGPYYVDLIFGFGGWRAPIDRQWYERGRPTSILGQSVRMCPVEDLIWIKAYVAHRERFDGADVSHLINATHQSMDWRYLLRRFDHCWQLLFFYVNLYRFIYPSSQSDVPAWLVHELVDRWHAQRTQPVSNPLECRGTLIDRYSFLVDIREGYHDGREPWVLAQGWTKRDLEADRREAERTVQEGNVRPDRVA
ncbi:MAG: nucleotidyltransferase [Chloroflexota bacterium]